MRNFDSKLRTLKPILWRTKWKALKCIIDCSLGKVWQLHCGYQEMWTGWATASLGCYGLVCFCGGKRDESGVAREVWRLQIFSSFQITAHTPSSPAASLPSSTQTCYFCYCWTCEGTNHVCEWHVLNTAAFLIDIPTDRTTSIALRKTEIKSFPAKISPTQLLH